MSIKGENIEKILVIGGGGHAKVAIEAIRNFGSEVIGVLDPNSSKHHILGVTVLGGDERLKELREDGIEAIFVAIGSNALRMEIGNKATALGYRLPSIIHSTAFVSPSAQIGEGVIVMAKAVVGADTNLHEMVIINTGAVVDHDNTISVAAHVAPGCALAGCVTVGARSLVGVGSSVRPNIVVGADAVIGAGSAVVANVENGTVVAGVPAKLIGRQAA